MTARWRWQEFYRPTGASFEPVLEAARQTAAMARAIPRTLVLLVDAEPVGTVSLTAHDLRERPDLTPWLAGMFVVPHARGRGYATLLIGAIEQVARDASVSTLWLFTNAAERIYSHAGWRTVETILHNGRPFALMQRNLEEP